MLVNIIVFIICLIVISFSASYLVVFAKKLSASFKISPLIIGTTIISLGTSMPEFSVAISSIVQKVPSISLGDIIGSNIGNVLVILGICIAFFPIRVGTEKTQRNNLILVLLTAFFITLNFIPFEVRKYLALGLLFFYLGFLVMEFVWGKIGSTHEDKKTIAKMENIKGFPFKYLVGMIATLFTLGVASKYLVSSTVIISDILKLDKEIIGLTIIALGTSLPELSTSIISGIKREEKILLGDIQGSNIFNLSVIGTLLIIFNQNSHSQKHATSLFFLALSTLVFAALTKIYSGKTIPRVFGLIFIGFYLFYLKEII